MNDIIAKARYNRFAAAGDKKKSTELCANYSILIPKIDKPVTISLAFYEPNRKRDIDNVAGAALKYILDGLVAAGRIKNDTREWVKGIQLAFPEPDKANPRIEVTLIEVDI
jgi:Holliday junction resolvase RusA-like endonuclease